VHALSGVGRNLHDHPVVEIDFEGTDALHDAIARATAERFVPEEQTLGKLRSTRATGPYDLHLIPVSAPLHSPFGGRTFIAAGGMEPRSRGRLVLASADPETQPTLDHGYLSDPEGHDLAVLVEGVEIVRELAASAPLRDLIGPEVPPRGDGSIEDLIRRTFVHYFHPVGTCAMGRADDPAAVCDASGRRRRADRRSARRGSGCLTSRLERRTLTW
jgi:choline dehydrogenase